jgi:imidazoleglycerol-phosphate dehydratase
MRTAKLSRKTSETEISLTLNLDGTGKSSIATTIPFLDHMLTLFSRHGLIDLTVKSSGDTSVDYHHLVEDVGICLGEAVKKALGNKKGISRYGSAAVPMDETLCSVDLDISGRPYLVFNADFNRKIKDFDPNIFSDFFKSFTDHGEMALHVNIRYGRNNHHKAEAVFKAFGLALSRAVSFNSRIQGVPSTKGKL